jgi:hypothetical protein
MQEINIRAFYGHDAMSSSAATSTKRATLPHFFFPEKKVAEIAHYKRTKQAHRNFKKTALICGFQRHDPTVAPHY